MKMPKTPCYLKPMETEEQTAEVGSQIQRTEEQILDEPLILILELLFPSLALRVIAEQSSFATP
ncbi:hypothetical protein YC2023_115221 [Brassica napus]